MSSRTDIHWKLGSILSEQKCHKFVVTTPFTRLVLFIEETKDDGCGWWEGVVHPSFNLQNGFSKNRMLAPQLKSK